MDTYTVEELIKILEKYPNDMKVYYSTKYALVPFNIRVVEKYLIMEMSDDVKELFND